MHETEAAHVMRALLPRAEAIWLVDARTEAIIVPPVRPHPAKLFAAEIRSGADQFPTESE